MNLNTKTQAPEKSLMSPSGVAGQFSEENEQLKMLLSLRNSLDNLEQYNVQLRAERDELQDRCNSQLSLISELSKQIDRKGGRKVKRVPSVKMLKIDELPLLDDSEFQPIAEVETIGVFQRLLNGCTQLAKVIRESALSVLVWLGKKTVAILT